MRIGAVALLALASRAWAADMPIDDCRFDADCGSPSELLVGLAAFLVASVLVACVRWFEDALALVLAEATAGCAAAALALKAGVGIGLGLLVALQFWVLLLWWTSSALWPDLRSRPGAIRWLS